MKKVTFLLTTMCFSAVAVFAQATGDYRSIGSSNWTDITIWQRFNGTAWKKATVYPTSTDGAITIQDGSNVTFNLSLSIDQVTVDGGATLNLTAGYTITLTNKPGDDLVVNGLFNMSSGTLTGIGRLRINNSMQWTGGSLQVNTNNNNKGTILIGNNVNLSSELTNSGTLLWRAGNIYFYGGSITNNNLFTCSSNAYLANATGGGTITNNAGAIIEIGVIATLTNQITVSNKGTINFNSGLFNNTGLFNNSKTLNFDDGAYQNSATTNLNAGTKVTGLGHLILYNNTLNVNAKVNLPAGITLELNTGNPLLGGTGSLSLSGTLWWYSGTIGVDLTVNNTGVVLMDYGNVTLSSSITNNGTINWMWGNIYFSGGVIINNKTFNISADWQMISNPSGSFANNASGTITKSSFGTTTIAIPITNKGTIAGTGTFAFGTILTNTGTFNPGIANAPGILVTGTNYTNGTLSIRMTGPNAGIDFDRLIINGDATLKGTLTVTASGNIPDSSYAILTTTGSVKGKFRTTNLPAGYTVIYRSNKVLITVSSSAKDIASSTNEEDVASGNNSKTFSLFPNPATQTVHINFQSTNKIAVVQIFDMNGKAMYKSTIETFGKREIDISKFVPGTYLLQLNDGGKIQSSKFIKQ